MRYRHPRQTHRGELEGGLRPQEELSPRTPAVLRKVHEDPDTKPSTRKDAARRHSQLHDRSFRWRLRVPKMPPFAP